MPRRVQPREHAVQQLQLAAARHQALLLVMWGGERLRRLVEQQIGMRTAQAQVGQHVHATHPCTSSDQRVVVASEEGAVHALLRS